MTATIWHEARSAARTLRAALGIRDTDNASAEQVIGAALRAASLRCLPRRPTDPLLSGAHAVLDTEAEAVWVRADVPAPERRVLVAHEIAHFHLHEKGQLCHCREADFADPDTTLPVGYGPRQRRETEANVFARELLLPSGVARRLFDTGQDARTIATQLGLPSPLVFAQLAELNTGDDIVPVAASLSLDASQEAAARMERGPLLVGAGPGTGKTRTLTARVLFLAREQNVAPDNILALTFGRKAAEEMRERIAQVAPDLAARVAVSTFHAYGLELLRRHGQAAGLPANPILLDAAEACALLERRAAALGLSALRYLHDLAFPLPDILRTIGRAKEDLMTPETFAVQAENMGDERLIEVGRVFAAYEILLAEKGAIDYADLVCRALRLLETNAEVLASERAQWKHVLVDEYQDVNRAGARLVQLLAGDGNGLWCVGDLRQAIYRFRGASPANVTRFLHDFPHGQRADLMVNYRSRPELVGLFGVAAESPQGWQTWQPARPERGGTIRMAIADDDTAQADGIANAMRRFSENGFAFRDQVVLCRTRGQARWLRNELGKRGIPVAPGQDENGLLRQTDVKNLIALLSRACEPNGPARAKFPDLPPGLPFRGDAIDFWTELLWGKPGWARQIENPGVVARLLSLARAFRDRSPTVVEGEEPRRAFLRHLRRMARLGTAFGDPDDTNEAPDTVRLLTVHAAKGLEFPVVFVPNLSGGKFPARPGPSLLPPLSDDEEGTSLEEEGRLFFVALTRAKEHLVLSRAMCYGKMAAAPSPLLRRLDRATWIKYETWEAKKTEESTEGSPVPAGDVLPSMESAAQQGDATRAVTTRVSTANEILGGALPINGRTSPAGEPVSHPTRSTPASLDAVDAELYLRCPRRFYYERVADLPPGERTLYGAFKRTVEEALTSPEPVGTLNAVWVEAVPDPDHPHASLYREAADEIVRRAAGAVTAPTARPSRYAVPKQIDLVPTVSVQLETGTLSVRPDAVDADTGAWEVQTFRRPPSGPKEAPTDEPRVSLLQEAARQSASDDERAQTVQFRYLQTGEVLSVKERPRVQAKHLAGYERAVKGIRLQTYPAAPSDITDCPNCPYFFVCPE